MAHSLARLLCRLQAGDAAKRLEAERRERDTAGRVAAAATKAGALAPMQQQVGREADQVQGGTVRACLPPSHSRYGAYIWGKIEEMGCGARGSAEGKRADGVARSGVVNGGSSLKLSLSQARDRVILTLN